LPKETPYCNAMDAGGGGALGQQSACMASRAAVHRNVATVVGRLRTSTGERPGGPGGGGWLGRANAAGDGNGSKTTVGRWAVWGRGKRSMRV